MSPPTHSEKLKGRLLGGKGEGDLAEIIVISLGSEDKNKEGLGKTAA